MLEFNPCRSIQGKNYPPDLCPHEPETIIALGNPAVEIPVHLVEAESLEVAGILVLRHELAHEKSLRLRTTGTYVVQESQEVEQIRL